MFKEIKKQIEWNGAILEFSTGKIARQADGAVMVKMGDSIVQCTVVTSKKRGDVDFFPLTVNYQEKAYAAGRIPGGFLKREGRGSEKEVLVSRLIDRPIRPLVHPAFFNETNILCTVHSFDPKHSPDILALIGASAALAISGIPYLDIVAGSRVGLINGQFVLNPTYEQLTQSSLELVVAGTRDSVMMVESEAEFLTEEQMLDAVKFGHEAIRPVIDLINELKTAVAKPAMEVSSIFPESLKSDIHALVADQVNKAFSIKQKQERYDAIDAICSGMLENFSINGEFSELQVKLALEEVKSDILRKQTIDSKNRIDGRKLDEVRPIECEVGLFPRVHGSALFTRGETQAIVVTTLGTGQDEQIMEAIEGEYKERFLLNYLFPQYSVGEVGPMKAPSRREVGHGKLGWRALKRAIPSKADFPYTVRVVSEISESNGSSSMATVCGGSMSMMNAGVPLVAPIAGIAMGLIKEQSEFVVLSDIIADEDHLGDMDFKVAGSKDGVTALQMDIKVAGITFEIMQQALKQAKEGRIHILAQMDKAISSAGGINEYAPMVESFTVQKDKIRDIIGAGGKVIREICETTGAKIDISDEGEVLVAATGRENLDAAIKKIKDICFTPVVGDIYEGTIVKILDAGAFISYLGMRDGFIHISEIAHERIQGVGSILSEGQRVRVKLIGFDRGKAQFTIKNVDNDAPLNTDSRGKPRAPRTDRVERSERSGERSNSERGNDRGRDEKASFVDKRQNRNSESKSDEDSASSDIKERKYFN